MKYSVLILTQDEWKFFLKECIEAALSSFGADEIVVVDGGSDDPEFIFKEFNYDKRIKVVSRPFLDPADYTSQRNYGLRFCTGDYILNIDADEILADDSFKIKDQVESNPDTDIWNVEGIHFVYHLGLIDNTLPKHIFLGRLFKRGFEYPSQTMHGCLKGDKTIDGIVIYHLAYAKGIVKYMLNKWKANSRRWEMHDPEEFREYVQKVVFGEYPVRPFLGKLPRVLKVP